MYLFMFMWLWIPPAIAGVYRAYEDYPEEFNRVMPTVFKKALVSSWIVLCAGLGGLITLLVASVVVVVCSLVLFQNLWLTGFEYPLLIVFYASCYFCLEITLCYFLAIFFTEIKVHGWSEIEDDSDAGCWELG